MYIIGGFNAGVYFCDQEAFQRSGLILPGPNALYDTVNEEFITAIHYFEIYNDEGELLRIPRRFWATEEEDDMPF